MPIYIKDSVHQAFDRLKSIHSRRKNEKEGSTGIESLDSALRGIHTGDLIVFAGFSYSYKTTLLLQILIHNLLVVHKATFFVSPALSNLHITNRLIALTSGIPLDKISGGTIEDHEWKRLTETLGMLEDSKLIISDKCEWEKSNGDLSKKIRDIIVRDQIKMVFIDHILIDEKEGVFDTQSLKELAVGLGITVFLVIDIPADQESPSYSRFEPSGNIGDYADALCFVHKESVNDPLEIGDGEVETITFTNYGCNCRLFVDEKTGVLLEEKDYKSQYIESVGRGA